MKGLVCMVVESMRLGVVDKFPDEKGRSRK